MNNMLAVAMVLGVSFVSAQEMKQSGTAQNVEAKYDSPSVRMSFAAFDEGLTNAPSNSEVSFVVVRRASGPASFVESIRKEISSCSDALPDLSGSWFGIFCYVRNPLRYRFAPETTYPHQIGFSSGDWILSVDGIKPNTLQDLNFVLRFSPGKTIMLFVKLSDFAYTLDLSVSGKLPWERGPGS